MILRLSCSNDAQHTGVCFECGALRQKVGKISEVRLEGGRAPAKGVVRLQASGVDADKALASQKKKRRNFKQRGGRGGREGGGVTVEQHRQSVSFAREIRISVTALFAVDIKSTAKFGRPPAGVLRSYQHVRRLHPKS